MDFQASFAVKPFYLLAASTLLLSSPVVLFGADEGHGANERDEAIQEFIDLKRQVTVKEISGALSITGEVHVEFQNTIERVSGTEKQPHQGYDIEFDLLLDYRTDRTWLSTKLKFDNTAGLSRFSGNCNNICLDRAYMGTRLISAGTYVFDVEIGRNKMSRNFDSKIEFNTFYDGIYLKYDRGFETAGDAYCHGGVFLIDEKHNQYGYVGEMGWINIMGTGFFTKLSVIDWDTKHFDDNKCKDRRFDYVVGQWLWGYKIFPESIGKKLVMLYAAYLNNFEAKGLRIFRHNREAYGGYLGVSIGQLKKKNDFAFDINYQVVAAQAIPDFDMAGIGFGNSRNLGLYTEKSDCTGAPTTSKTAAGNGNFRGFSTQLDYLFTDNIMITTAWAQSIRLESIGPFRWYKQFEFEFVYSF